MEKIKKVIVISAISASVLVIIGFGVVPTIKKHGIRKRLDTAYKDPSSLEAVGGFDKLLVTEAFDPNKFNDTDGHATISRLEAREKAKIIWDNYSKYFSSNQTEIIGAFNGLHHMDDVSKISHEFTGLYDEDLLTVLKTALTDKAKYNILISKINKLPNN